uniref:hypothetical protein n=1 Tax=Parabacteroides distasonis TaxID=823 RepID=UPI003FF0242F
MLKGNTLLEGRADKWYDEVGLTDSYLILLDRKSDTIIQVFKKEDLSHLHAFALKGYGAVYFSNPEFMKSNTKETARKDEFWIVDNQLTFNKMQVLADSLRFDRKYILIPELVPSTHYNVTTKEIYAVPIVEKNVYGPFCYANREEGIYWVESPKVARTYRFCKHIAFYDLKGTYQRSFTYGKEPIVPLLKKNDTQVDVLGTTKCFIDICGTDQYVYCLYDGSVDFSNLSTLLVLSWDGKLKKQLNFDRSIKRIAVDSSDRFLVALAQDESGVLDVVKYLL